MGLDMYLYARKYVSGIDYTRNADGGIDHWENTDLDTVASVVGLERKDLDEDMPSATVSVKVAQWRKANQVHEWFVRNVQLGEDNCREYYVSRDELKDLRQACREVLEAKHRDVSEDLLPSQVGFFFGSTEYDDYYYEQVQYTHDTLDKLLNNDKFKDFDFAYDSSW